MKSFILFYKYIIENAGPGELPWQHCLEPRQYFGVVIFTFMEKPIIE